MGTLNKSVLGEISGKIGGLVFRKVKGKIIISQGVRKYNTGESIPAKKNRNRFAAAAKFAKAVNSIDILSSIWKGAVLKGHTAFHKIQTYNLEFISDNHPTINNVILYQDLSHKLLIYNFQSLH